MLSRNPFLTYLQIESIIQSTSDKIGPYPYDEGRTDEVGYGRINAYKAVLAVPIPSLTMAVPQNFAITSVLYNGGPTSRPKLTWTANTEQDLEGYKIERKADTQPTWLQQGVILKGQPLEFIDVDAVILNFFNDERVYYRLRAYSDNQVYSNYTSIKSILIGFLFKRALGSAAFKIPKEYQLAHNIPNPFNPVTRIEFALPEAGFTRLIIYDLQGREVATLIDGEMSAGIHNVTWNARNVASGVYIYRLMSGNYVNTKKMILLK